MSGTVVLVPVLITAWPMLASAVGVAAAAAGFNIVKVANKDEAAAGVRRKVEVTMENMEVVAEELALDDQIIARRDDVELVFSRDGRGVLKICAQGDLPKDELRKVGEDMAGRVIQRYIHARVTQELQNQGFLTTEEGVGPDEAICMTARKYE